MGPEVQLDTELPFDERLGRNVVEADPWRYRPTTKAPEIRAFGFVGAAAWLAVMLFFSLVRALFYWLTPYGTEALLANVLFWGWLSVPAVALLVGGAIWAYGETSRRKAEAQRMSVTRDRFGNPIAAGLVLSKSLEFAARELLLATQAEMAMAPHRQYRGIDSLSVSYSNSAGKGPAPEGLLLAESAVNVGPVPVNEWMEWLTKQPHVLLAAETGGGKSTTAKAIAGAAISKGAEVFIIDPHSSSWGGVPSVGGGEDWSEVEQATRTVLREYEARLETRDVYLKETGQELPVGHFKRLVVIFDEANNAKAAYERLYARNQASNPWTAFVKVLGSGARKVNISVILLVQSANVEDLGISGGLRNNFTRLACDDLNIKRMVANEEFNPERKKALTAALAGATFPATTVISAEVFLLNRDGLDQMGFPANAAAAAWQPGYESVRPSVPSSEGAETVLLSTLLANELGDEPEENVMVTLKTLRAAGITREKAREMGHSFTNTQWTEAGK